MAATTAITEYYGSGPPSATITNLRYSSADESAASTSTYPLVKPSAGTNYSYLKTIALTVSSAPAGSITNIAFYTDGANSFGTGVTVKGAITNTYAQATGTQGTTGDLSATFYTSGTDLFTYTSAPPLSVTSNATTGTGRYSYYLRSQMALSTSVSAGTLTAETYTFRFDET